MDKYKTKFKLVCTP